MLIFKHELLLERELHGLFQGDKIVHCLECRWNGSRNCIVRCFFVIWSIIEETILTYWYFISQKNWDISSIFEQFCSEGFKFSFLKKINEFKAAFCLANFILYNFMDISIYYYYF